MGIENYSSENLYQMYTTHPVTGRPITTPKALDDSEWIVQKDKTEEGVESAYIDLYSVPYVTGFDEAKGHCPVIEIYKETATVNPNRTVFATLKLGGFYGNLTKYAIRDPSEFDDSHYYLSPATLRKPEQLQADIIQGYDMLSNYPATIWISKKYATTKDQAYYALVKGMKSYVTVASVGSFIQYMNYIKSLFREMPERGHIPIWDLVNCNLRSNLPKIDLDVLIKKQLAIHATKGTLPSYTADYQTIPIYSARSTLRSEIHKKDYTGSADSDTDTLIVRQLSASPNFISDYEIIPIYNKNKTLRSEIHKTKYGTDYDTDTLIIRQLTTSPNYITGTERYELIPVYTDHKTIRSDLPTLSDDPLINRQIRTKVEITGDNPTYTDKYHTIPVYSSNTTLRSYYPKIGTDVLIKDMLSSTAQYTTDHETIPIYSSDKTLRSEKSVGDNDVVIKAQLTDKAAKGTSNGLVPKYDTATGTIRSLLPPNRNELTDVVTLKQTVYSPVKDDGVGKIPLYSVDDATLTSELPQRDKRSNKDVLIIAQTTYSPKNDGEDNLGNSGYIPLYSDHGTLKSKTPVYTDGGTNDDVVIINQTTFSPTKSTGGKRIIPLYSTNGTLKSLVSPNSTTDNDVVVNSQLKTSITKWDGKSAKITPTYSTNGTIVANQPTSTTSSEVVIRTQLSKTPVEATTAGRIAEYNSNKTLQSDYPESTYEPLVWGQLTSTVPTTNSQRNKKSGWVARYDETDKVLRSNSPKGDNDVLIKKQIVNDVTNYTHNSVSGVVTGYTSNGTLKSKQPQTPDDTEVLVYGQLKFDPPTNNNKAGWIPRYTNDTYTIRSALPSNNNDVLIKSQLTSTVPNKKSGRNGVSGWIPKYDETNYVLRSSLPKGDNDVLIKKQLTSDPSIQDVSGAIPIYTERGTLKSLKGGDDQYDVLIRDDLAGDSKVGIVTYDSNGRLNSNPPATGSDASNASNVLIKGLLKRSAKSDANKNNSAAADTTDAGYIPWYSKEGRIQSNYPRSRTSTDTDEQNHDVLIVRQLASSPVNDTSRIPTYSSVGTLKSNTPTTNIQDNEVLTFKQLVKNTPPANTSATGLKTYRLIPTYNEAHANLVSNSPVCSYDTNTGLTTSKEVVIQSQLVFNLDKFKDQTITNTNFTTIGYIPTYNSSFRLKSNAASSGTDVLIYSQSSTSLAANKIPWYDENKCLISSTPSKDNEVLIKKQVVENVLTDTIDRTNKIYLATYTAEGRLQSKAASNANNDVIIHSQMTTTGVAYKLPRILNDSGTLYEGITGSTRQFGVIHANITGMSKLSENAVIHQKNKSNPHNTTLGKLGLFYGNNIPLNFSTNKNIYMKFGYNKTTYEASYYQYRITAPGSDSTADTENSNSSNMNEISLDTEYLTDATKTDPDQVNISFCSVGDESKAITHGFVASLESNGYVHFSLSSGLNSGEKLLINVEIYASEMKVNQNDSSVDNIFIRTNKDGGTEGTHYKINDTYTP